MIEVTDEMRGQAYHAARVFALEHNHSLPDDRMLDEVITRVLALVNRSQAGPCSHRIQTILADGILWCKLQHGHTGDHQSGLTRWNAMAADNDVAERILPGARVGYEQAIATLHDVAQRTGSPAARWAAEYLEVDPDRRGPVRAS